jgi:hypothetical protein
MGVPFDPWSASELEKHKREIVIVMRAMLGIEEPRGGSSRRRR